jgi:E3 ubiquitin-protein ligase HERC2
VELCENGANISVTYENAREYADMVERYRLDEGEEQYALIRKGLSAIIPMHLLNYFNWKQLETKICGTQDVDVDILMEKTDYDIDRNAPVVALFWEVMREMTPQERSLFLRFVWGRSRLPQGRNFKNFKLASCSVSGPVDNYLPVAHTCFFQLDLPAYTTKEICRDKIVYAVTHCQAIDLDRAPQGGFGEED